MASSSRAADLFGCQASRAAARHSTFTCRGLTKRRTRDQSAEPQGESVAGSETILLVEDEEAVRALAAEVLRECGYQVLESTPEDALQVSERHTGPIHLLLTDVVMPRVSGRKIADLLVPARMLTKVLYMSGYPDGHIVHDGVLQADTALLQKPFTPISLARKVREVLDASS